MKCLYYSTTEDFTKTIRVSFDRVKYKLFHLISCCGNYLITQNFFTGKLSGQAFILHGVYSEAVNRKRYGKRKNVRPEPFDKTWENSKINPFLAKITILYPLKTPQSFWFSVIFMEY